MNGTNYTEAEARQLPPLALAYIGDSVFELFVRETVLAADRTNKVHTLHREAVRMVNARSQAAFLAALGPRLTEAERYIVQRGKNAKPHSVPKNADILDYKQATALEALVGFLYLTGKQERLREILRLAADFFGEEGSGEGGTV